MPVHDESDVLRHLEAGKISDVLVRFARHLDERDWRAYADLYTEDCTLTTPRATHQGRVGLAEFVERDLGGYTATHHVTANHSIEIDRDVATVRSSLHATHVRNGDPTDFWAVGGWYDTVLHRTPDGHWLIHKVKINPVWHQDTRP
ncbi:nuclear transport factor 2 family protein [Actinomadura sp. 21ATH]|uniref:nuclear transport factor 2 family protein n=1 Tax=Actinomadura sp. 21ATH TaxID=1735444 RepID=UPI0035BFAA33